MKIGYICSDFDVPLYGEEGCSIHVRDFVDALVEEGHDVFVVCAAAGEASDPPVRARVYELQPDGVATRAWQLLEDEDAITYNHLERDLRLVLYNAWLAGEGGDVVRRERPDFLYERYALFGHGGLSLARALGIPHLLEVNAPLTVEQAGYKRFRLTTLAARMESELLAASDRVIVVSEWLREWALGVGADADRLEVVPNAVSRPLFESLPAREVSRERLGIDGTRTVGFVGSFQPWHDVAGLLRAFRQLHEQDPGLRLLLVGAGRDGSAVRSTTEELGIAEAVHSVGHLPHEAVPEALAAMDVAVAPYNGGEELGFLPLKLFEYMASGRPVVAANVGRIADLVEHGRTGLLYRPGDEDELASALRTVLYDGVAGDELGRAARDKVLRDHTWNGVARRVVEMAEAAAAAR